MKSSALFLLVLLLALTMTAQVPTPQIPLGGKVGSAGSGFPLMNSGTLVMPSDANYTMAYPDMTAHVVKVTSSVALTTTRNIIAPLTIGFEFIVENATTGGQPIQVIGTSGTGVTIPNGQAMLVMTDGTKYVSAGSSASSSTASGGSVSPGFINANANGVKSDAKAIQCTTTAGSGAVTCDPTNYPLSVFSAADVGKTFICYGCGAASDSLASLPTTYVSGGTVPAGYPSGSNWQRVDFTDGGPSGGPCTVPPAMTINVNNGVIQMAGSWRISYGMGCTTVPTHGQIAGFSGVSTFSGGALGHAVTIHTITAVTDSTHITISPVPITAVSKGGFIYGTDDTGSFKALIASQVSGNNSGYGSASITWTGASIISDTLTFPNFSGFFGGTGNMPQAGFGTYAGTIGTALVWAGVTASPRVPMINNEGGANMSYGHFTLVGNATARPIGIELSGYQNGSAIGAQNLIDDVVFGLYVTGDPSWTNGVGEYALSEGIRGATNPGNADFERLCVGVGCTFNGVAYPVEGDNDMEVEWQFGTLRVFNAVDAFCVVGAPSVAVLEVAAIHGSAIHLGSCQYYPYGNAKYGTLVIDRISSDGEPQLLDASVGFGSVTINGGAFGYALLHNDGLVINGFSPAGNATLTMNTGSIGPGVNLYSGFPPVLASLPNGDTSAGGYLATTPQSSNGPSYTYYSWLFKPYLPQTGLRGWQTAPVTITDTSGARIQKYPNGVDNGLQHPMEWETMGISESTGLFHAQKLRSPDYVTVAQVSGATPGATTYTYAVQCVINGKRAILNFDLQLASGNASNSITTGAATLTPANANQITWHAMNGCENYYIYRKNITGDGLFYCLAKGGSCVSRLQLWLYNYTFNDDGSYTQGTVANTADETGSVQIDGQIVYQGKLLASTNGLADFSTSPPATGTSPVFDATQQKYVPKFAGPAGTGIAYITPQNPFTAGDTTANTANYSSPTYAFAAQVIPSQAGTVADCKIYWMMGAGTGPLPGTQSCAIYDSDGTAGRDNVGNILTTPDTGTPGTFICRSATGTAPPTYPVWNSVDMSGANCPMLKSGHTYWAVVAVDNGSSDYGFIGAAPTITSPPTGYLSITAYSNYANWTDPSSVYREYRWSIYVDMLTPAAWANPGYNNSNPIPANFLGSGSDGSGTHCLLDNNSWGSCGTGGPGGSMTWPGAAGIANYSGSSSWGTSYSATNTIPANFLANPLTQNTSGNAASASALATSGTANQVWGMNAGGTAQGWQTSSASMVWPTNPGTAGTVPNYSGSNSWGTSYGAANPFPTTFIPTLNQNTAGSAAKIAGGALGSIPYQSAASTTAFLSGNTAATDQVLVSHGTGGAANAPTLSNAPALSAASMTSFPTLNQSTTGTAAGLTGGTVGSIHYQSGPSTSAFLNGNTAATDQVLVSHGTGSAAQAPTLNNAPALSAANMTSFPTLNQNTTGTAANLSGTQTANYIYAAPNGSAGTGIFRAMVAADVPTLNQNTTGNAATATQMSGSGTANQVWGMDSTGSTQGWQAPSGGSGLVYSTPVNGTMGTTASTVLSTTTMLTPTANTKYRFEVIINSTNVTTCTTYPSFAIRVTYTDPNSNFAVTMNQGGVPLSTQNGGGSYSAFGTITAVGTNGGAWFGSAIFNGAGGQAISLVLWQQAAGAGCGTNPTFTVRPYLYAQ